MTQGTAGFPITLFGDFEAGGAFTDPSSVTLDITYGSALGGGPDFAGPFGYSGAASPTPGQVYRVSTGKYAYQWQIPSSAPSGSYVANWTFVYQGTSYLGTENVYVTGGSSQLAGVPSGDVGFWTGAITYASAGLDIEFGTGADSNGIAWLWQRLQGWDSPPVQGAGVIPRAGDHGGWPSPQYYGPRTMTWTVTAMAPTQALRDQARALLQQAIPVSDLATLRYDEPVPKVAYVRRSGQVAEAYTDLFAVTFTAGLVAPDPRKYAAAGKTVSLNPLPVNAGGGMTVPFTLPVTLQAAAPPGSGVAVNAGNFESPPVFVISGPLEAPAILNLTTGQTVTWSTLNLGAGHTLVVDTLLHQAYVDPSSVSTIPGMPGPGGTYWPADTSSSWWQLQPGGNALQLGGAAGTGAQATCYFADTWS